MFCAERSAVRKTALSQNRSYHFAVYIGQAVIASGMAEGELLVVEPEQMQDRRVKVVNVDAVLADRDAELVRRSIGEASFYSPHRQSRTRRPGDDAHGQDGRSVRGRGFDRTR